MQPSSSVAVPPGHVLSFLGWAWQEIGMARKIDWFPSKKVREEDKGVDAVKCKKQSNFFSPWALIVPQHVHTCLHEDWRATIVLIKAQDVQTSPLNVYMATSKAA